MTKIREAVSADSVLSEVDPDRYRPQRARVRKGGLIVIGLIVAVAAAVPAIAISVKRDSLMDELHRRLEILARGRAEVVEAWLEGVSRPTARVVESELFRLFATEVDLSGGDISDMTTRDGTAPEDADLPEGLGVPLAAQLPFMAQVLGDFVKSADFLAGYVVGRNGIAYVTSAGADTISPAQQATAGAVIEDGQLRFGPVRTGAAGPVMDIYAPILAAQSENGGEHPVAVLLVVAPVGAILSEALASPALAEPGERLAILQVADGRFSEVVPGETPPLRPIGPLTISDSDRVLPFAQRGALGGEGQVFSVGVPVAGPPLWVIQEIDAEAAEARLKGFITAAILLALLAVAVVVTAFGAFWWRLANEHSSALATQFRNLAARIAAQKRLLDDINNSIAEYIGLKARDGTYRYINPAFARAIGREVEEATGLDDAALFGKGTAERLALSDRRALAENGPITISEQVYLGNRLHYLQISKVPFEDENGAAAGIVSVTRDVTELVEEQKRRERAIQQMVNALVRAVELRDPYLAGHSRRLAGFAVAVARRLGAEEDEVATLEIAANLSQIGKLAIPREILNKPERLSAAEVEQVQEHLEHAVAILRDIDFELPVLETVYQMHERLDGGGYPKGLKGDSIRRSAQILGTCDVFCARVEPRAYRSGISARETLAILEDNAARYSPEIVAALREVVESVAGEKLVAGLAPE